MLHLARTVPRRPALVSGPRERLVHVGIDALSDVELVALLLGTGSAAEPVHVVATRLLEEHGGVGGLSRSGTSAIAARHGVGFAKASRITAAIELGRRVQAEAMRPPTERMVDGRAVDAWARPRLGALDHEELWVLAVDGQNGLRAARRVGLGGLHGLHVSLRDPLRAALREAASAFVLVHNHPGGDATPSLEDIEFTRRLSEAAELVGAPLLDHVIVARTGFTSMLERALLPEPRH
jgi:DNA repair protein RadC